MDKLQGVLTEVTLSKECDIPFMTVTDIWIFELNMIKLNSNRSKW